MDISLPGHVLAVQDNIESWLTGGSLRDTMLGRESKDYDLASPLKPNQIEEICRKKDWGFHAHGKSFLVSTVTVGDNDPIEIATFRTESDYTDGRRPNYVGSTLSMEEDSQRRDFTMNALYWRKCKLVDYHGGEDDIRQGIVRCVGNPSKRFAEDYLRILRLYRFCSQLGFIPDIHTAIAATRESHNTKTLSGERVFAELDKFLAGEFSWQFIMNLPPALRYVLSPIDRLKAFPQFPKFHPEGNVLIHTAYVLRNIKNMQRTLGDEIDPQVSNWAALFHDAGKCCTVGFKEVEWNGDPKYKAITYHGHEHESSNIVSSFLDNLNAPRDLIDAVAWICDKHMIVKRYKEMRKAGALRMLRNEHGRELIAIGASDHYGGGAGINWDFYFDANLFRDLAETTKKKDRFGPKFISGKDIIALGLLPGPSFKEILDEIEDAQLENPTMTEDETRQLLRSIVEKEKELADA